MSTHPVRNLAATAARTVGRRLRARRGRGAAPARVRDHATAAQPRAEATAIPLPQAPGRGGAKPQGGAGPQGGGAPHDGAGPQGGAPLAPAPDADGPRAGAAELDALRGALVHELDRLAAGDDCSASFRRAG